MVSTFFDPTTSNLQGLKRSQVEALVEKKHHDCGDLRGRINKVLEALMGE